MHRYVQPIYDRNTDDYCPSERRLQRCPGRGTNLSHLVLYLHGGANIGACTGVAGLIHTTVDSSLLSSSHLSHLPTTDIICMAFRNTKHERLACSWPKSSVRLTSALAFARFTTSAIRMKDGPNKMAGGRDHRLVNRWSFDCRLRAIWRAASKSAEGHLIYSCMSGATLSADVLGIRKILSMPQLLRTLNSGCKTLCSGRSGPTKVWRRIPAT